MTVPITGADGTVSRRGPVLAMGHGGRATA